MAIGWVYVLTNADMPGLVKIGQSASDPDIRSAELFTTGVPSPFSVAYKGLYDDYARLERLVHVELSAKRHSANREFFRLSVHEAIQAVRGLANSTPKYEDILEDDYFITSAIKVDSWTPLPNANAKYLSMGAIERQKRRESRMLANGFVKLRGEIYPACPVCRQAVRVPSNRRLRIKCPTCGKSWTTDT